MGIDVRELRVGNLVSNGEKNYTVDTNMMYDMQFLGAEFFPIPLTDELLVKCGFEKVYNEIICLPNDEADLKFELSNGVLIPDQFYTGQPMTKEACPKYLHQLQNLIYALTGKELIISL
jgi:hypothetical protein